MITEKELAQILAHRKLINHLFDEANYLQAKKESHLHVLKKLNVTLREYKGLQIELSINTATIEKIIEGVHMEIENYLT